jgi:hypothetical protein
MDELDDDDATEIVEFQPARFSSDLGLPSGHEQQLKDAAVAVRQEFRDSSRWQRLNCKKISIFAERDRGTVYVVHIGKGVEFDWPWEGARAFCAASLDENPTYSDHFYEETEYQDEVVWSGEIVEVDEQNGCPFVALDNPEKCTIGPFFVRPFEFLSVLDAVYNGDDFEAIREQLPAWKQHIRCRQNQQVRGHQGGGAEALA